MKKSDKGMKIWGVIVILAINVSVFCGAVSAEDLLPGSTQSVADAQLFDEKKNNINIVSVFY